MSNQYFNKKNCMSHQIYTLLIFFSKIDSAPLVGSLIDTYVYHTNFSADLNNSLVGSASQKIFYSKLFLQLRK